MDVYVRQILGANQPHDLFYTNTNVKVANMSLFMNFLHATHLNLPHRMPTRIIFEPSSADM